MKFTSVIPYVLLAITSDVIMAVSASPVSLSSKNLTAPPSSNPVLHRRGIDISKSLPMLPGPLPIECTSSQTQLQKCKIYLTELNNIFNGIENEFTVFINKISKLDESPETKGWIPLENYATFRETISSKISRMKDIMVLGNDHILARPRVDMSHYWQEMIAIVTAIRAAFMEVMIAQDIWGLVANKKLEGFYLNSKDDGITITSLGLFVGAYLKVVVGHS